MKRVKLIMPILVMLFVSMSCVYSEIAKIKRNINRIDRQCPINLGISGDLINFKYDKPTNTAIMYIVSNEGFISIDVLRTNEENMRQSVKLSFQNPQMTGMLNSMVRANMNFKAIYKGYSSGKTAELVLTPDDMREILNSTLTEYEKSKIQVDLKVATENLKCPVVLDEGMEQVKVELKDGYMVFCYRMDEEIYSLPEMQRSVFEMKEAIRDNLIQLSNDLIMKSEIKLLKELGLGYQYHYYGDTSDEVVDIYFPIDELLEIFDV